MIIRLWSMEVSVYRKSHRSEQTYFMKQMQLNKINMKIFGSVGSCFIYMRLAALSLYI
jgi:hypothetical protein